MKKVKREKKRLQDDEVWAYDVPTGGMFGLRSLLNELHAILKL